MTLIKFLPATCAILALAGCGTSKSEAPAASTPPAEVTTASGATPSTEAPASEEATKSSPAVEAPPAAAPVDATATTVEAVSNPTPRATATERLTDQEVKTLLERIEKERSAFEAALDPKLKNSTMKGDRGEVKTNEFFDDMQDQLKRTRDRFSSDYSASSEVLALLQLTTRLNAWVSSQPAEFKGSSEWRMLATDVRRLAGAYNSPLLSGRQPGVGVQARRINDAELVTAAANIEKNMDPFRKAYDSALAANSGLTTVSRQTAIQTVDTMGSGARTLRTALEKKQKGIAEANALLKGSAAMASATLKLPPDSSAAATWTPIREDLAKVALGYEITPLR